MLLLFTFFQRVLNSNGEHLQVFLLSLLSLNSSSFPLGACAYAREEKKWRGGEKKSCGRFTLHFRILKSHELVLVHHYTSMSTEGKEKRKENNNNTNRHTHIHVQTKQNKNTIRKTLKTNNTICLRVRACRIENTRRNERWWG